MRAEIFQKRRLRERADRLHTRGPACPACPRAVSCLLPWVLRLRSSAAAAGILFYYPRRPASRVFQMPVRTAQAECAAVFICLRQLHVRAAVRRQDASGRACMRAAVMEPQAAFRRADRRLPFPCIPPPQPSQGTVQNPPCPASLCSTVFFPILKSSFSPAWFRQSPGGLPPGHNGRCSLTAVLLFSSVFLQ